MKNHRYDLVLGSFHFGPTNLPPSEGDGVIIVHGVHKHRMNSFLFSCLGYQSIQCIYSDGALGQQDGSTRIVGHPGEVSLVPRYLDVPPTNGWFVIRLDASREAFAPTNDHCLVFKYQARHDDFEWHMYFSRMLATPEWNMDSEKIPLPPDKAWQIAKGWFMTNNCPNPELVKIEIFPVVRVQDVYGDIDKRLTKRFYYRFQCVPGELDTMVVYVLMDGTVLEPIREPPKDIWW